VTHPDWIRTLFCCVPHQVSKRGTQLSRHDGKTMRYVRSGEGRIGSLIAQLAQHRPKIWDGRRLQNTELALAIKRSLTQQFEERLCYPNSLPI